MKDPNDDGPIGPSDERAGAEPLSRTVDLERWEAQLPPDDFADRVLGQIDADAGAPAAAPAPRGSVRRRRALWGAAVGAAATLSLAAAMLLQIGGPASEGQAISTDRVEVALGKRGIAVLEPGASVQWKGDDVTQSRGDVFYRVEHGERFRVHTPAGDVEVKGTCFTVKVRAPEKAEEEAMQKRDLRSGVVGGALTALAFVAVYEGKVAVSHASERADLVAGESAQLGAGGVTKSGVAAGEKAFDTSAAEAQRPDEPLTTANQRLAHQVGEYRSRLEAVAAEKVDLEKKLKRSEESLAATQDGSGPVKRDFDFTPDDWKEMAKEGTMKFRVPCVTHSGPWTPKPDQLNALGLSPQDGNAIKTAYARANQRAWDVIKPLCVQFVGTPEVADRLGPEVCQHVVLDNEKSASPKADGPDATSQAVRLVAEMRAGMRPLPGPNDDVSPSVRIFLSATSAEKAFEDDLAQSFGPEEAHRIAFSDELCMSQSSYRTSPKKPKGNAAAGALDDVAR